MTDHDWLREEPSFGVLPRQLAELLRRGAKQPRKLLLGAAVLALLLFAGFTLTSRRYAPRVVLRVLESERDPASVPELKRQLADYVREGVLTAEPLLEIRQRYGLYPKALDRTAAVVAFRRDIDVDVYQNYFVEPRSVEGRPRSARVVVSYRASERATALAVTRELASLIVARVKATRQQLAERAVASAEDTARSLQGVLTARYERLAQVRAGLRAAPDPNLQVEIVGILGSVGALELQVDAAEKRAATLELGAASELSGVGLRFEVAEDAVVPLADRRGEFRVIAFGLLFFVGIPFVVLAAGAGPLVRGSA